jgi:hypothetical protein
MECHGLGIPGAKKNPRQRRWYRRLADARDQAIIDEIYSKYLDMDEFIAQYKSAAHST